MLRGKRKVFFLINCTQFEDYDVIAFGEQRLLKQIRKDVDGHFIKKSIIGVPLLVLDTCNKISEAKEIVKDLYIKYNNLIIKS